MPNPKHSSSHENQTTEKEYYRFHRTEKTHGQFGISLFYESHLDKWRLELCLSGRDRAECRTKDPETTKGIYLIFKTI